MKDELKVVKEIAQTIEAKGGDIYYVGGYVRDIIIGKENKDIDVEVYGITKSQLKSILSEFGIVDEVGSSFGVYMIHGLPIDFAMPRRELLGVINHADKTIEIPYSYEDNDMGLILSAYPDYDIVVNDVRKFGHKDFVVVSDPYMTIKEASSRRDIRINSLLMQVTTGVIFDPWGGLEDIRSKVIRHVNDETFVQDPLRVLRVCQFASRFNFTVAKETIELCRWIDLDTLPKERIFEEIKKGLLKSEKPSIVFDVMNELGVLDKLFPELKALIGCPQNPEYHPEGDCSVHTKMVLDHASKLKEKSKNPLIFMLSSLLHDIGKPKVTEIKDGRITSIGHDAEGVVIAKELLERITNDKSVIEGVCHMVENHMRPHTLYPGASDKAIRRLAVDTDVEELLLLAEADSFGKCLDGKDYSVVRNWFNEKLAKLGADTKIVPLVTGKDLINLGMKPGKEFKEILTKAFDMQLDGMTKEDIMGQLFG